MLATGKKIGVDAGSSAIKIVELTKGKDGLALACWSALPFKTPPNSTPEVFRQVQAKAIDAAIKKGECKCRDVVVGVPGSSAFIRNIKLPPIPSSKIDQIVRYEIQQTIPFPIENIALDYQVLEPDESSEVEVIMVAMKGEVAENFIRDIEQAKVRVGVADSIPLALYNCYLYNGYSNKEECTVIIEIGASGSNILIELGGELRYCRSVSIGGNDITKSIAKEFNIPLDQAERLKMQYGLIFPESQEAAANQDQARLSRIIAASLDRLMSEVKLTIGYFRSLTGATAVSRGVVAGGGALLKNIRPFLAERLGVQVEIINPLKKVAVPQNLAAARKVAPILATCIGLALRNSQDCCQLKISLIPPKVKEAQSRRSRLTYNVASVLVFLGIIGAILWRMIPEVSDRSAKIAWLDQEIARYAKFEPQLQQLKTQKDMLNGEYIIYGKYPDKDIDAIMPLVILNDSLGENTWIQAIKAEAGGLLTVQGTVKTETKVDQLKQLSRMRLELEKYCKQVSVKKQTETNEGLSFELELKGVSDLPKYLALRQAEERKTQEKTESAAEEPAQQKKPGEKGA
jgi:type IV pilus assembly protein PilM